MDDAALIAFLKSEVERLQARVSELGAELAAATDWQTTKDKLEKADG